MRVEIIARQRTTSNALSPDTLQLLATELTSVGVDVTVDVCPVASDDVAAETSACADQLREHWDRERPDLVHAFGIVAVGAAVAARPRGLALVATFDEWPSDPYGERGLAREVDMVLSLSGQERERWRELGVPTMNLGTGTLPVVVPDPEASPVGRDVITLSAGSLLEPLVDALPRWPSTSHLLLLGDLPADRLRDLRDRATALGMSERLHAASDLRDVSRTDVWNRASVLVAGPDGVRHGAPVLEAAAHGVPCVAPAEGAYLDHVIPGVTGILLEPGATGARLARAVRPLLSDRLRVLGLGTGSLLRIQALHDPAVVSARIRDMYTQLVGPLQDAPTPSVDRLSPERVELALDNLGLAQNLAHWYAGRGQAMDDLVQVANLGLVLAAERFDPGMGKEFRAFAIPTILGELRRYFRGNAWAMRVSRGLQETTLLVQSSAEQLSQSLGHEASAADLAADLELEEGGVVQALRALGEARSTLSLDLPVGRGSDESFGDLMGLDDPGIDRIEKLLDVRAALRHLPARELEMLRLRFYGERTQAEIAQRLGISQVHVSRVLSRTLETIRDHVLNDTPLPQAWEALSDDPVGSSGLPSTASRPTSQEPEG